MDQLETLQKLENIGQCLELAIKFDEDGNETDTSEPKSPRMYNQPEAMKATGFTNTRTIKDACEALGITTERDGKKFRIEHADIIKLREHNGLVDLDALKTRRTVGPRIICVSSLKGGVAKSSTATNTTVGLATELPQNYRTCLIDLDPQGTSTDRIINLDEEMFSIGDLLTGNFELEEGETFEDICRDAVCDTHIPNVKIIPARESDENYELTVKKREIEARERGEDYIAYKDLEVIINAIKDDFDFIIFDTPPRFSAPMLSAHYVSNSLIIPFKPNEGDRKATRRYSKFLTNMYKTLIGLGHSGYDSAKVLFTIVKKTSKTQRQLLAKVQLSLGDNCFDGRISDREAEINCNNANMSIFDVSPSQYKGTRNTIIEAQTEFRELLEEIEDDAKAVWGIQ